MRKNKVKSWFVKTEEFNNHLMLLDARPKVYQKPSPLEKISSKVWLYQGNNYNYHLIYKNMSTRKVIHLECDSIFDKIDTLADKKTNVGGLAFKSLNRLAIKYNEQIDINFNKYNFSWEPYLWYDERYQYLNLENCYQYDINSAYLYYSHYPLPYGEPVAENRRVEQGEIGFRIKQTNLCQEQTGELSEILVPVFEGQADVIFKTKIYQCLCEYADKAFKERKKITDPDEKALFKIKQYALFGTLKYHNCFITAAIVGYLTRDLRKLKSKTPNVIMCTIDSITSIGPIENIDLGNEMGQFKLEHTGNFYYCSTGKKKWNDKWIAKGMDHEKQEAVREGNCKYYFNKEMNRFICQEERNK